MKVIDGIELLRMIKNGEVKADTEIKVWFDAGFKEYITTLYFDGKDLKWQPNTFYARYFYNKYTKFEIIEAEKDIEEISPCYYDDEEFSEQQQITVAFNKINELVRELNKIKKEGK